MNLKEDIMNTQIFNRLTGKTEEALITQLDEAEDRIAELMEQLTAVKIELGLEKMHAANLCEKNKQLKEANALSVATSEKLQEANESLTQRIAELENTNAELMLQNAELDTMVSSVVLSNCKYAQSYLKYIDDTCDVTISNRKELYRTRLYDEYVEAQKAVIDGLLKTPGLKGEVLIELTSDPAFMFQAEDGYRFWFICMDVLKQYGASAQLLHRTAEGTYDKIYTNTSTIRRFGNSHRAEREYRDATIGLCEFLYYAESPQFLHYEKRFWTIFIGEKVRHEYVLRISIN